MSTVDLSVLNQKFGIPGQLTFQDGPGGMAVAEVGNVHGAATIVLQGAHLVAWSPHGQESVIWLSPVAKFAVGEPIRGGVPICWPWFGPHSSEPAYPAHGHARIAPWEVLETALTGDGATYLAFRLIPGEAAQALWPHSTPVEIHLTVGETLEIELVTHNLEAVPIVIGQALHTYFRVGDVRRVEIRGLEGCPYIDKVDSGQRKMQEGPVIIASEVDRIYLNSSIDCLIGDPVLGRRIRISKRGSASTIVWNPWIEKAAKTVDLGVDSHINMVCVETANASEDVAIIPSGAEHRLWVRYAVEGL